MLIAPPRAGKIQDGEESMSDLKTSREGLDWMLREVRRGRMNRREFIQLGIAAGLGVGVAEATFRDALAQTPKKGGSLRLGISWGSTSDTMDPGAILDPGYMGTVNLSLRSLLAQVDEKGNIGTDLAESFEPSNGAKTWVVKLRRGVTFHNGKDVTANDVVASVRHHMGPNSKSALKAQAKQIEEIKADGGNVIFTLKGGSADFPYFLSEYRLSIMPATENGQADWQSGIGTGPYVLQEFKPGQVTRAKRNPNYYRDTWFDDVTLLSIIDPTARTNALLSGQLDMMDRCDAKILKFMSQKPGIEIDKVTGYENNVFVMIVTAPPFDNPDVRNALKYAIDRQAIIDRVFGGIGVPGNDNVVAPSVKFAIDPKPIHKYDPDMAKSLLKKAGLPNLKVNLSAADVAFTGAVDAATVFRESAARAGIDLTVIREPNDGYWDNVWQKKPFCASEWLGRPTADAVMTFEYAADSNQNDTFWKNPRFNELLTAARSELDEKKRAAMYAECQQLVHDDNGVIVIMFTTFVTAHSSKVAHGPLLSNLDLDGGRIAQRWWHV
jgi:peptide/nickel transport system substrate-binding protein